MPTYYMQAFILPTWVVQNLQKITRRFLWRGSSANYSGDHCLVQWAKVTLPKSRGGLGVTDLKLHNIALALKWLWIGLTDPTSLWSCTLYTINANLAQAINEPQARNLSFYIQDILKLLPIFNSIMASPSPGTLNWNLTATPHSQSNRHDFLNNPSIHSPQFATIWTIQAPPKVRFFVWLLLHNKINTANNLLRKGWPATPSCVMCNPHTPEDAAHLFITCPLARQLQTASSLQTQISDQSVMASWTTAIPAKKEARWAAVMWTLWKERNSRIFRGTATTLPQMTTTVWELTKEWNAQ
jgi:zinc-binding in reverse transcriptase